MDFRKLLYIGAYDHIEITDYFKCDEYIFIDLQPLVSWDIFNNDNKTTEFYNYNFISIIIKKFESHGFMLTNVINLNDNEKEFGKYTEPHLILFENKKKNRKLKYYVSTNIRYHIEEIESLKKDIIDSDVLYVAGYYPNKTLLNYFPNKKAFISDSDTIYYIDINNDIKNDTKNDTENIIDIFGCNISDTEKYFHSFYNIDRLDKQYINLIILMNL